MRSRPENPAAECNRAEPDALLAFEESAVAQLKRTGLRITGPRLRVIQALGGSHRALTANQIHESVVGVGSRVDLVTVYRVLQTLLEVGLVHRIGVVDGYYACRSHPGEMHNTEHFVCRECGCVMEIPMSHSAANRFESDAEAEGFQPGEIRVEVLGVCAHCQERG